MNLAELQTKMLEAVTQTGSADPGLDSLIPPARGIRSEMRLDAYRSNIRGAHLEALDAAYPVTREVLGLRYWRQLLAQEIPAFGSQSPDLHEYGDFLPELLSRVQESRKELADFGYLSELAQLEWQVHLARFKAPDPDFDWVAFQALESDQQMRVQFTLSHALHLMWFSQPVDALWHSHQENDLVLPPQSPVTCCIHRQKSFDVAVTRLSNSEQELLEALGEGQCLEALPAGDSQATVQTLFDWIQIGWISGFLQEPIARTSKPTQN
ncbi:MAG: DNA-binding domain-containing protein [Gammaproteobacteria bacterium]|nr:DNA-binding domain-containing protein [Gammaproteobacteria bacterium]MDE0302648.1 DNA-binding domain-containing protein [Gammaproteobacteria bacterium]MDE0612106.1 DNA-binding domain-containing protein [Gammaproteobacteria bacterium]